MTEMELRNLALARAAAAECQMFQHHQHHHQRPTPAVVPAFYPPNVVPAAGQNRPAVPLPFSVVPDRGGPALLPAQPASLSVYRPGAPVSSNFNPESVPVLTTGPKSNQNPSSDDGGGRLPVPDSKTRPTSTGSRSTTPVKRHTNSFSIDSLLGRQEGDKESRLGLLEVRKSSADRVAVVDAEARQGDICGQPEPAALHRPAAGHGHRPVVPACFGSAPVPRTVPGFTARPELVTWFWHILIVRGMDRSYPSDIAHTVVINIRCYLWWRKNFSDCQRNTQVEVVKIP